MSAVPSAPRRSRRRLDGVLLLDKPLGMTSNHALQAARRLFNAAKAGHTGTLDPLATGLLPLCFGEATKFSGELLGADKRYRATIQLGVTTTTADAEGEILARRPVTAGAERLQEVLAQFVGEIDQVPPMHSALKHQGRPLYDYARAGVEIVRPARRVCIHSLHLGEWDAAAARLVVDVECSKGTYVRTLAADIGERLGCGAHLGGLRRTGIGVLDAAAAHTLDAIERMPEAARDGVLLPVDALLHGLPAAHLGAVDASRLRHGQAVRWSGAADTRMRAYDGEGALIGLCHLDAEGWLCPQRLVATEQAGPHAANS